MLFVVYYWILKKKKKGGWAQQTHSRPGLCFVLLLADNFVGLMFRETEGAWSLQASPAGTEKSEPIMTSQSCIFVQYVLGMVLKCPQWSDED